MRNVIFLGSTQNDLMEFPEDVREKFALALREAQLGSKAPYVKPLAGFGGASVLEVVDSFDGDAYRAIYTVRFKRSVYVLHVFKKKSKSGIATPKRDIELIKRRLKLAEQDAALREREH
jgi:phage-related protein